VSVPRPPGTTARRRVALIGVAAILLQALLFGWHHHGLPRIARGGPAAGFYDPSGPLPSTLAEDSCEICAVLHHQNASPLAFTAPPAPAATASAIVLPAPVFLDRTDARGFRARAPPRV
jgi:hypothetical protein